MNRKDFGNAELKMFVRPGFSENIISTTNKNIAAGAALSNKFFTIKF